MGDSHLEHSGMGKGPQPANTPTLLSVFNIMVQKRARHRHVLNFKLVI